MVANMVSVTQIPRRILTKLPAHQLYMGRAHAVVVNTRRRIQLSQEESISMRLAM